MLASLDRLLPIVALAALAAATVWLERVTRSDEPRPTTETRAYPDFIGKNIRLVSFGEDGRVRYTLVADAIRHFPLGDVTEFEFPRLRYKTEEGLLRAFSDRGESHEGGELLHLKGNAEIHREGIADSPDLSVLSDKLTLWPDDQRAASDVPVVLTHGLTIAHGNSMRANNMFGHFELIGDTRVTMPPRSSGTSQ